MNNLAQRSELKERVAAGLARRYRRERAFEAAGLCALLVGLIFLGFFFFTLIGDGYSAFRQTVLDLDVELPAAAFATDTEPSEEALQQVNYLGLVRDALRKRFPDVTARAELRDLFALVSTSKLGP